MTHPLYFTKPKNFYLITLKPKLNLLPINVYPVNLLYLMYLMKQPIPYLGKLKALVISAISSWLIPSGSNPIHLESM